MDNKLNIPASLIPALRIFETELQAHLTFFDSLDLSSLSAQLQDENFRSNLMHRFHTIKGGAGFFSLERILRSAATAEKLLQKADLTSLDDIASTIASSIKELQVAVQELRSLSADT